MHLRGPHKRRSRASGARGHSSHETQRGHSDGKNRQNKHADPVKPGRQAQVPGRHEKAQGTRQYQSRGMSPAATRRQGLGEARLPPAVPVWGLEEATRVPRCGPAAAPPVTQRPPGSATNTRPTALRPHGRSVTPGTAFNTLQAQAQALYHEIGFGSDDSARPQADVSVLGSLQVGRAQLGCPVQFSVLRAFST